MLDLNPAIVVELSDMLHVITNIYLQVGYFWHNI
jgi:hypothetical protein